VFTERPRLYARYLSMVISTCGRASSMSMLTSRSSGILSSIFPKPARRVFANNRQCNCYHAARKKGGAVRKTASRSILREGFEARSLSDLWNFAANCRKIPRFMGSFGSLQGKKCSKTVFFRIFLIKMGKARQTPRGKAFPLLIINSWKVIIVDSIVKQCNSNY
jgi:hypothetical protein